MVYLFSNVYHYKSDDEFLTDLSHLKINPNDIFVFLNTCIPYLHGQNFFKDKKCYSIHRRKGTRDAYFGLTELSDKKLLQLKLDTWGHVYTDNFNFQINIGKGYNKRKEPTSGFYAYYFCKQYFSDDVTLVNFYGSKDNTTGKWSGHDWAYEEKILAMEKNRLYFPLSKLNMKSLQEYIKFLNTLNCQKIHYLIDDILFNTDINYLENIDKLDKYLNIKYISNPIRYLNYPRNNHHWTTQYVWETIIPTITADLNIPYDKNDFITISKMDKKNDLTYHQLKNKNEFIFSNLHGSYSRKGDHSCLRCKSKHESGYHELYAGCHSVSLIKNKTLCSNRRLIINCDSMAIPIIPILACYFDEILCLDNRTNQSFKKIIEKFNPTHYIAIGLYRHYFNHYNKSLPDYIKKSNNKIFSINLK